MCSQISNCRQRQNERLLLFTVPNVVKSARVTSTHVHNQLFFHSTLQVARNYRFRRRFQLKNRFTRGSALHLKGLFALPRGLLGSSSYLTTGALGGGTRLTSARNEERGKLLIPKFVSYSNSSNYHEVVDFPSFCLIWRLNDETRILLKTNFTFYFLECIILFQQFLIKQKHALWKYNILPPFSQLQLLK